jgi:hypothetical protein
VRFKTGCFVFGEKLTRIYAIADVRVIWDLVGLVDSWYDSVGTEATTVY